MPGLLSLAGAAPSKLSNGSREGLIQLHDVHGFTASISNPRFGAAVSGGDLPRPWWGGVANRGLRWIYLHASEQGRPLYESVGFEPSTEMRLKLQRGINGK